MSVRDEQNLDLLSTLHYIMGALTVLFACIPVLHLTAGIVMFMITVNRGDFAPRNIALILIILAAVVILIGWTLAILILICGRRLKQRRAYNYCLVIAFLECLIVPIGSILGIFSIATLTKEPVKELFT